jgi:hypothetical protein
MLLNHTMLFNRTMPFDLTSLDDCDLLQIWRSVEDTAKQVSAYISGCIRCTSFEYWLLKRQGQASTFFITMMLCALIWLVVNHFTSHRSPRRAEPAPFVQENKEELDPKDINEDRTPISAEEEGKSTTGAGDTAFIRMLAPPDHRPTNAQLNIPPFRTAQGSFKRTSGPAPDPIPPFARLAIASPPPLTTKGDLESGAASAKIKGESMPGSTKRNLSKLEQIAPTSYEMMQEQDLVDEDGMPTQKYYDSQLAKSGRFTKKLDKVGARWM